MERQGTLLIADITGYTNYLNESELEHAQGTLTDLLNVLIDNTLPPMVVSQLEGDAVLSYGLADSFVCGQTFLEMVEDIYVEFRHAIDLMVLNNTCQCAACANVSSLDLKFFVHHGTFALQQLGETEQLVGSDVNLVHRLLKNTVTASTGVVAYLLVTGAAMNALELSGVSGSTRHVEQVDDYGPTEVWVRDMRPVFDGRKEQDRIEWSDGEVHGTIATDVALPPPVVWDYLSQPPFRRLLTGADRQEVSSLVDGRVGVGAEYTCWHGDRVAPQPILEWRPFERMVMLQYLPLPGRGWAWVHLDVRLTPTEDGTRLEQSIARFGGPRFKRFLGRMFLRANERRAQADMHTFRDLVEQDHAERIAGSGVG